MTLCRLNKLHESRKLKQARPFDQYVDLFAAALLLPHNEVNDNTNNTVCQSENDKQYFFTL